MVLVVEHDPEMMIADNILDIGPCRRHGSEIVYGSENILEANTLG